MHIASMDKRITIYKPVSVSDEYGGRAETFSPVCSRWAEFLRPNFANHTMQGDGRIEVITQGIRLRPIGISKGWQIHHGELVYEVLHVDVSNKQEIILTTVEVKR